MPGSPRLRTVLAAIIVTAAAVIPSFAASPSGDPNLPSLTPVIAFIDGSHAQHQSFRAAVARFLESGLALPDLQVRFHKECAGHMGLFEPDFVPWRITVCSDAAFVPLHELAHAWELANLTDRDRAAFMELRGHTAWADPNLPWRERGVEDAAFVIQQGLLDVPLPRRLSDELQGRLKAFLLLTGKPSPRVLITS